MSESGAEAGGGAGAGEEGERSVFDGGRASVRETASPGGGSGAGRTAVPACSAPQSYPLKSGQGASRAAQWQRIRLPTQGTQVPSLVREDPTC